MRRFVFIACCIITVTLLATAQTKQGSLASLIQRGDRKAALERIRAGADVNEAQPDGTRPIHWAVFKVDYALAGPEQLELVVDLRELERGPRAIALALGPRDIGIVELALQPAGLGNGAFLRRFHPLLQRAAAGPVGLPCPAQL